MPKQNIEYTVTRSFDSSKPALLERLIEYIEEQGEIENNDGESSDSNCRDLL